MAKPTRIESLETLARESVGDGKGPRLYFVTDQGTVVTVTRSLSTAYTHWRQLADRRPQVECALEDRHTGVLASVGPDSDELGARLIETDDTGLLPPSIRSEIR